MSPVSLSRTCGFSGRRATGRRGSRHRAERPLVLGRGELGRGGRTFVWSLMSRPWAFLFDPRHLTVDLTSYELRPVGAEAHLLRRFSVH